MLSVQFPSESYFREHLNNSRRSIKELFRGSLGICGVAVHYTREKKENRTMNEHEKVNYLELPASDLRAVRDFFSTVFGWRFTDYGPDYSAFSGAGIDGGFFRSELCASTERGSVLVVFYSKNLGKTQRKVEQAGGTIVKPVFSFPGGCRFHFVDPCGNEYAVWSEQS